MLAEYFSRRQACKMGVAAKTFDAGAMEMLTRHGWPGNVRELENLVERLYVLVSDEEISTEAIQPCLNGTCGGSEHIEPGFTSLEEAERVLIEATLKRFGGHRAKTAETLGIGLRTLGMKVKQWGLAEVRG